MNQSPAERMVDAARSWLGSLTDEQRHQAMAPWPSDDERHRWYYTPTNHGGLPLAHMSPAQQGRAMQLVATGLSKPGYVTATTISLFGISMPAFFFGLVVILLFSVWLQWLPVVPRGWSALLLPACTLGLIEAWFDHRSNCYINCIRKAGKRAWNSICFIC